MCGDTFSLLGKSALKAEAEKCHTSSFPCRCDTGVCPSSDQLDMKWIVRLWGKTQERVMPSFLPASEEGWPEGPSGARRA